MNPLKKVYTNVVLRPLADHLIARNMEKASSSPSVGPMSEDRRGWVLRDVYGAGSPYMQTGNLRSKPGSGVTFEVLRTFAVQYDVARACINRRKRKLSSLEWDIVPEDESVKANDKEIRKIKQQFKHLGGYQVRFREMLSLMIEDLLVLDALAIYKRPTVGGTLHSLQVVDAATIKLVVDAAGRTPEPPETAYRQVIRGAIVAEFTADEMYYEMMNPRTSTPYGLSPLESFIIQVSAALKSEVYNNHMLTEGNIPEGLYNVDANWSSDQIKQFQQIWDDALAGNTAAISKIRFVPPGTYTPTMKPEDMRYQEFQQWLMKKCCMLFEIQPQELGFTETVNRSTGEVQNDIGKTDGLIPLARFLEEIFTDVLQQDMGLEDLKFKFMGLDVKDEKKIAETNKIKIESGQITLNEARAQQGLESYGDPLADIPMIIGGSPSYISTEMKQKAEEQAAALTESKAASAQNNGNDSNATDSQPTDDNTKKSYSPAADHIQLVTELRTFRKYAVNRIRAGKELRAFKSEVLPESTCAELNRRLSKTTDVDTARSIFDEYMQDYQIEFLADVASLQKSLERVVDVEA